MATRSPFALMYQQRAAHIRTQLVAKTVALYEQMPTWSDPDSLAVPAAKWSTLAQEIQAQLLQAASSAKAGQPVALDIASVIGDAIRNGDITESWRSPMYSLWSGLAEGSMSQDELISWGSDLVETQAITDLSYSQREAVSAITNDERNPFIGYWRVPSPGSSCEFCVTIADRLYHTEDLMPVHPGCACSVEPALPGDG